MAILSVRGIGVRPSCKGPILTLFMIIVLAGAATACAPWRRPAPQARRSQPNDFQEVWAAFDQAAVMQHLAELTSPAYTGRAVGSEGEAKAAAYIAAQLASFGLRPWREIGLSGWEQGFSVADSRLEGHNIAGVIEGSSKQWLLLAAHYDHLGIQDGVLYPGADDNAAAVAISLEIARCLAQCSQPPLHNLAFVFLSGEEENLSGSRALAQQLREQGLAGRCRVVNLDMLGGTGGNSLDVWREPSQPSGAGLARQVMQAIKQAGLKTKSVRRRFAPVDSRAFARLGIPSVTLSWAYEARYHPYRHQASDTVEHLRPELLAKAARGVFHVVWVLSHS